MNQTSKRIVFFGNERLATGYATDAPTLSKLIKHGYDVAAVITNHETSKSRSARQPEVAYIAEQHNIPVIVNQKPSDMIDTLASFDAIAGVLVAYGNIVPQRVIDIFPRGIINIHPSLLPLHRGPTPIESVMLSGEAKTGISLMKLAKAMDAGDIYANDEFAINGSESKYGLTSQLLQLGSELLIQNLPAILDGSLTPWQQDDSAATYDRLISKEDGIIDWQKPAVQIEREVRAFSDWPKSRSSFNNLSLTITQASILKQTSTPGTTSIVDKMPVVQCGTDALILEKVIPAGKKEMTGESFLAGYKHLFLNN